MNPQLKSVIAIAPTSTTNGATTTGVIDTLGHDFCTIDLNATTSNDTTNKFSVCKVSQSDTTDATNYSDITPLVAGGTGGFTLAAADTSNPYTVKINVDCRTRKRYLKLTVSPRTTQTIWAQANLGRAEAAPVAAAAAGANTLVEA